VRAEGDDAGVCQGQPVRPRVVEELGGHAECFGDVGLGVGVGLDAALPFAHAGLVGA
jgi:hypothetical protein